jgi:hypothetical protein
MVLQLNPPLALNTPKGAGLAHLVIDYGPEADLVWVIFLDSSGQCWSFRNQDVRAVKNTTMGRQDPERL